MLPGQRPSRIEPSRDEYSISIIRVLDIGGMLWEGDGEYDSVTDAMEEADGFNGKWRGARLSFILGWFFGKK